MTIDEIKERAIKESLQYNTQYSEDFDLKKFIDNSDKGPQIDRLFRLLREKAYRDGYIAGAKDNAPQWHYPSNGEFPGDKRVLCLTKYWDIWIGDRIDENTRRYKWKLFTDKFEEYYGDDEIIAWQDLSVPSMDTE